MKKVVKNNSWKRTGIDRRPPVPYVKVIAPKKGKGAKNDRGLMKAKLRQRTDIG